MDKSISKEINIFIYQEKIPTNVNKDVKDFIK